MLIAVLADMLTSSFGYGSTIIEWVNLADPGEHY